MGSGRPLGLSRSSPSCLNRPAQRTDFVHGLTCHDWGRKDSQMGVALFRRRPRESPLDSARRPDQSYLTRRRRGEAGGGGGSVTGGTAPSRYRWA